MDNDKIIIFGLFGYLFLHYLYIFVMRYNGHSIDVGTNKEIIIFIIGALTAKLTNK